MRSHPGNELRQQGGKLFLLRLGNDGDRSHGFRAWFRVSNTVSVRDGLRSEPLRSERREETPDFRFPLHLRQGWENP